MKLDLIVVCAIALFAVTMNLFGAAQAQQVAYPAKTVRLVVPFAAGGTVDPLARVVAQELAKLTGVPFIIENKPSAGTEIAIRYVMASPPDGYTMLVNGASTVIFGTLNEQSGFNPNTDLTHFAQIAVAPSAVLVRADSPYKILAEMLDKARAAPDSITYGTPGVGTPTHIFMESMAYRAGVKLRHIPYKGAVQAMTDLIGGHISLMISSLASATPHIRKGSLRALAVTSRERQKDFPALQTAAELFPGLEDESWLALSGPARVPPELVARISALVGTVMANPEMQKKLVDLGQVPAYLDSAGTAALYKRKTVDYSEVIKRANIKIE
ncbi:MAG: tripartite tricarboxylate transporter substrate binding protein [Chloroflexota bacterium]